MKSFGSIIDAVEAVDGYRFGAARDLPEPVQATLRGAVSVTAPVDKLVGAMEALYANREALGEEGRELVAALSSFCASNGWHGLLESGRGNGITLAMLRDNGTRAPAGYRAQKPEADPEPDARFVVAASDGG